MSWIETYTGQEFHFNHPETHHYKIEDIAHSLALTCRFAGHTSTHYSIAQHSCEMARMIESPVTMVRYALLHDATEAYLGDVTSPLKALMPEYKQREKAVETHIFRQLLEFSPTVIQRGRMHLLDLIMLGIEARRLLPSGGKGWPCLCGIDLPDRELRPLVWQEAESWYLHLWHSSFWGES